MKDLYNRLSFRKLEVNIKSFWAEELGEATAQAIL